MDSFFQMMGPGGLALLFAGFVVSVIWLMRYSINKGTEKAIREGISPSSRSKKLPVASLDNYRGTLRNVGLIVSIAMVLAAFEYPSYGDRVLVTLGTLQVDLDSMIEIPQVEPPKPKPPVMKQPVVVEAEIEEEILEEEIDFGDEPDEDDIIEDVGAETDDEDLPVEKAPEFVDYAEVSAAPKEGMQAFLKWVANNLKYPAQAKRTDVQGKVYIQFIVEKDGTFTNVNVLRGIGAGCDEEALKVIKQAKPWSPGKQRGRPVRQRMVIPIHFRLAQR
ncbi:energy transducer TonB [Flammeovirgaceae bacterium SG7u.111]|nr:energy transducer TonB [Flammeovirgaceae bacterium SG7u.132]WPO37644.1 energy transducer TonB [Flammeovirgaceae bacterium SG7u.111]